MDFRAPFRELKFNENHDERGRFAAGGTGTSFGSSQRDFVKAAKGLYKAQGVKNWEEANPLATGGPRSYFGTSRSFDINQMLRNPNGDQVVYGMTPGQQMEVMDAAERVKGSFVPFGVTVDDGTEVYRSVRGGFAEALDKMKEGDSFVDNGFVSTAAGEPDVANFGTSVMQITTKGSHRVMLFGHENEVLFEPGRKFTYHGKSQGKGADKKLTFYNVTME